MAAHSKLSKPKVYQYSFIFPDQVMLVDEETVYNDISGGSDGSMASVVTAALSVLLRLDKWK